MTWMAAAGKGTFIFGYFVVTTVWLPDFILRIDAVADASSSIRDIVILAVWGGALGGGVWLLRRSQRQGLI